MNNKWFNIYEANGVATIDIFDEIGYFGIDATDFKSELDKISDSKEVVININSPGGNVFDGVAIYNMIKQLDAEVTVEIVGLCASIASVIAMAGDKVIMRQGSFMMIHKPMTMIFGNSDDLFKQIEVLDKIEDQIINIYKKKTNLSNEALKSMLKAETWLNDVDAMEYDFVDMIDESTAIAAKFQGKMEYINEIPETLVEPDKDNKVYGLHLFQVRLNENSLKLN
jgi:ATP-dependent protease ClpP protease subunit